MNKIIILGASGDLAKKKIMPALSKVYNEDFKVYGYARSDLTENYSDVLKSVYDYNNKFPESVEYIRGEYSDLSSLKGIIDSATIIYFSLPPQIYPIVLKQLNAYDFGIAAVEKPFGENLETFRELLKFKNEKIRFIDHYLLKPIMLYMFDLNQSYKWLFDLLGKENVSRVECYFNEKILADGRSTFDRTGIVKDVMQNHLTEVLASILCQKGGENYEKERTDLIKKITIDCSKTIFGQYTGYEEDIGIPSKTETCAGFWLKINDARWEGVPFLMFAGKALESKKTEINFVIKPEKIQHFLKQKANEKTEYFLNEKTGELVLKFSAAPNSYVSYDIVSYDTALNKEDHKKSKIEEMFVETDESIKKKILDKYGKGQDYEILFRRMANGEHYPSVSFEEASELWRLFSEVIEKKKDLVKYEPCAPLPKKISAFIQNIE